MQRRASQLLPELFQRRVHILGISIRLHWSAYVERCSVR